MFLENLKDVTVGSRKTSERFADILRNFYRKRTEKFVNVFRKFQRYELGKQEEFRKIW